MQATSLSAQALDVYRASRDLVRAVEAARITDTDLSDHAIVAARSAFVSVCEGLPDEEKKTRRASLARARAAIHHLLAVVDLAVVVDEIEAGRAREVEALATKMEAMLTAIERRGGVSSRHATPERRDIPASTYPSARPSLARRPRPVFLDAEELCPPIRPRASSTRHRLMRIA